MKLTKHAEQSTIILQSNRLIEARQHFTLTQKRLFLYVLSKVNNDLDDFENVYTFTVKELASACALSKKTDEYAHIKQSCEALLNKIVEIREQKSVLKAHIFSAVRYKSGVIEIELSNMLKPYLLKLKKEFTRLRVFDLLKLKSIYSVRIYELLKQFADLQQRTVNIDDLRFYLNVEAEYKHIKEHIKRAQKELEGTICAFDFIEHKSSRRVNSITFKLMLKKEQLNERQRHVYFRLTNNYKLTHIQALEIIMHTDENKLLQTLEKVRTTSIKNKAAYILSALNS
jgi:plasmid replication initiation protein